MIPEQDRELYDLCLATRDNGQRGEPGTLPTSTPTPLATVWASAESMPAWTALPAPSASIRGSRK